MSPLLTPFKGLSRGGRRYSLPLEASRSVPWRNALLTSPFLQVSVQPKFATSCKKTIIPTRCTVGESSFTSPAFAIGSVNPCAHMRALALTGNHTCGVRIDAFLSR